LCSFAARIVASVSRRDQRIGSKAVQDTSVLPPVAVVVSQPASIAIAIASSAARRQGPVDLLMGGFQ
jgi:hypothetical protein